MLLLLNGHLLVHLVSDRLTELNASLELCHLSVFLGNRHHTRLVLSHLLVASALFSCRSLLHPIDLKCLSQLLLLLASCLHLHQLLALVTKLLGKDTFFLFCAHDLSPSVV